MGSGMEQMIIYCHNVKNTITTMANILNIHQFVCLGSRRDHEFVCFCVQFLSANYYSLIIMREIFIIQNVNNYERNLYVFDTKKKAKKVE